MFASNQNIPGLSGLDILLVEPHQPQRTMVRQFLRDFGARGEIVVAIDALEALSQMRDRSFGLVITAQTMNPMTGGELVSALRRDPDNAHRKVPVLMAMDDPTKTAVRSALAAGTHGMIVKPFSRKAFGGLLESTLNAPLPWVETDRYAGPDHRRRTGPAIYMANAA